jgi:hypothetical protein
VAIDDVYKVVTNAQQGTEQYMLSFNFRRKAEPDVTSALLLPVANAIKEIYRAQQVAFITWTTWEATQQWGPNMVIDNVKCLRREGLGFAGVFTAPVVGPGNIGETLPPQCAMVTTLQTGITGRRRRGRSYMFGLGETQQNEGFWASTYTTAIQTAWNTFLGLYGANGTSPEWELGIWSERIATGCVRNPVTGEHEHPDPPQPELAFTPVVSALVRSTVFTQRRRTRGHGR